MVSRLEKLLLGITAVLTFSCGEEATEQCREGREWNGRECVVAEAEYDAGNDTASEEPEPECYTHQECGDDYLCVEGSCESIEEACRIDTGADCNNNSPFFRGVYSLFRSDCSMVSDGQDLTYFVFDGQDCQSETIVVGIFTNSDNSNPTCYQKNDNFIEGNYLRIEDWNDIFSGSTVEFIQCNPDTILLRWPDQRCNATLEKMYITDGVHCSSQ